MLPKGISARSLPVAKATTTFSRSRMPTALAASHWRLLALMVDYLFWLGVIKLIQQWWLPQGWDLRLAAQSSQMTWSWLIVLWLLLCIRDFPNGRGLGKRLTGLAVVSAVNPQNTPTLWQLTLRNLTLPLLPLEAYFTLQSRYGLRWGDRLAKSVVVTPAYTLKPLARLWGMLALVFAFALAAFIISGRAFRHSHAFQTALEFARTNQTLSAQLGQPISLSHRGQLNLQTQTSPPTACVVLSAQGPESNATMEIFLELQKDSWIPQHLRLLNKQTTPCTPAKSKTPGPS